MQDSYVCKSLDYYLHYYIGLVLLQWGILLKWGTFSPFLCLAILRLVLPSNFIVARVKIRDSKICFNFKHDCIFYFIDIYSS